MKKKINNTVRNLGFWFAFFAILYVIILLKVITYRTIPNDLFFGFYGILITAYILSRFLFAYFHRSPSYDESYEPTVTFVVPAKDEEDNIVETIRRFGEVEYPPEKIEVVAVDDGSTDRTYERMCAIKEELESQKGIRVDIVHWDINRGKRHGMAEGIKRATHDIIIFIDSDSFIEPGSVRHLVKYFSDPRIGAVSGHTDVYNRDTNRLTRMQALRYYIAFKVYKAAESIFATVTCCPGCCSAYRRAYLLEFVDAWLHQKFLGAPCTFGDDRSLTNFIIRKYEAAYSPNATAYTVVPDNMKKYIKQQQRWKKSWVRETFIAATFIWRKNPVAAFFFYLYSILAIVSPVVFFRAIVWYPIAEHGWPVVYLMGLILMLLLQGIYYRIATGDKQWFSAIITSWSNGIILMWQLPWAFVTIRDSRWGTR
ncbi:MAG: glycosyltransferase family 2 protein [Chloroflexi bacterium]|nr:glycosyltransferase family 2 protein [Chloroflexota bacterium]